MALHDEEMNRRQQRREEMRQKREAEQKRLKVGLIIAAIILVVCAVAMVVIVRDVAPEKFQKETEAPTRATTAPTETQASSWLTQNTTSTIHIRAGGDLNITDSVVASGLAATG